jgi:flagellin-like hook-associated protein FlgL
LTTHGFALGDAVYYNTSGVATTIGGLTNNTKYYAIPTSTTSFQLAASASDATTGDEIALTSIGSGTQHFTFMPASNALQSTASHNFTTGEAILYTRSGVGSSDIGGLSNNTTYYAIESTSNTFKLATTAANATAGTAVVITSPGSGTQSFTPVSDILSASNHGFSNTNPVVYSTSGAPIGGLANGATYYVRYINSNTFELAASPGGAKINHTSAGSGTQTFTYMPGTNAVTINGHGFAANEPIVYSTTGTPIGGLTSGTTYYAIQDTANTFKLAAAANGAAIPLTSPGTGTQSFTPVSDALSANSHGFSNTNAVVYSTTGTPIGGLTNGTTYYARSVSANSFELAASPGGAKINLTSAGSGTHSFLTNSDAIRSTAHGLQTGDLITYKSNGGTAIAGLVNDTTYGAIRIDADSFNLAVDASAAQSGTAINLTGTGNNAQTFSTQSGSISTASIVGAIAINSSNRAELGARLNTLSYAIDSLQTLSNNLSEAYSRIVDTDYAAETSNLTKNKILQEAATAMLAQANQMPNVILTLLK